MKIGGLQKVTLVDYPGKIACTVFLSGCNFRCPFCYSKELVVPEEIEKHPAIDSEYFFSFLRGRKGKIEGCVLCGGEPTVHGKELIDFAKKIKDEGFLIKLDTNGSNPEVLKEMIGNSLLDYIAMDIKSPFEKYGEFAKGIDVEKIKESVGIIKNSGVDYEFRTTVVPGLHSREDLILIAEEIAPAKKYFLQNFRSEKGALDERFDDALPYDINFLKDVGEEISKHFEIFRIR